MLFAGLMSYDDVYGRTVWWLTWDPEPLRFLIDLVHTGLNQRPLSDVLCLFDPVHPPKDPPDVDSLFIYDIHAAPHRYNSVDTFCIEITPNDLTRWRVIHTPFGKAKIWIDQENSFTVPAVTFEPCDDIYLSVPMRQWGLSEGSEDDIRGGGGQGRLLDLFLNPSFNV